MQQLRINGGNRLVGEVRASGAKNAALPILAAALLTADDLVLHNVPDLADVRTMLKLLEGMGHPPPCSASCPCRACPCRTRGARP